MLQLYFCIYFLTVLSSCTAWLGSRSGVTKPVKRLHNIGNTQDGQSRDLAPKQSCLALTVGEGRQVLRRLRGKFKVSPVQFNKKVRFTFAEVADTSSSLSTRQAIKAEFFKRSLAEKLVSYLFRYVLGKEKEPGLVFDVGMNAGYYTMVATAHGYKVHAFELQPYCFNFVKVSALLNEVSGQVVPHIGPISHKKFSLMQREGVCRSGTFDVRKSETWNGKKGFQYRNLTTISLDDVVQSCGVDKVALLKMDIDGAEVTALHSMRNFLDKGIVANIILEIGNLENGKIVGTNPEDATVIYMRLFELYPFIYRQEELLKWKSGDCAKRVENWENMLSGGNILMRKKPLRC